MIRVRLGIATMVAALCGAVLLGLGGYVPPSGGTLLAQAPIGADGLPAQVGPGGIMPLSPNSPNNPQNYNPNLGSPVAPVQSARPGGWPGGPDSQPDAGPTRKAYAPAFGALPAGAPPATAPGTAGGKAALMANSAASQPASTRLRFPPPDKMVFEGAEIIAWVGSVPILAADVLYETNKMMDKALAQNAGKDIPPAEIAKGRLMFMRTNLKRLIETKLLFLEAARNVPAEAIPKIEKQFNEQFDKTYMRKMIEGEGCGSRSELEAKFRRQGTTVEGMRRQAFEGSFAARWLEDHVKNDDEITHDNMRTFYQQHFAEYEKPRRLRWEHLMVRFDKFNSKAEAFGAIAQWGNQIFGGASFAEVAKAHSQDPTADDGGVHPWTSENSLRSEVLDKALFALPVNQLSTILEDDRGFHIVRVIEREDTTCRPFTEVQGEIRTKIREERTTDRRSEYLEKLRAKTPVWTIFDEEEPTRTAKTPSPPRG